MQLLGFNYKAAIGEPLTEICAKAITAFGERKNLPPNKRKESFKRIPKNKKHRKNHDYHRCKGYLKIYIYIF